MTIPLAAPRTGLMFVRVVPLVSELAEAKAFLSVASRGAAADNVLGRVCVSLCV